MRMHSTTRAASTIVVSISIGLLAACSHEPSSSVFQEKTPSVHVSPTWAGESLVAFENLGATNAGPGWLSIDPASRGIVTYNVETTEYQMAIPNGIVPSSTISGSTLSALQGDRSGPIVLKNLSGLQLLDEPDTWTRRTYVSISYDGSFISWRSFGDLQQIGMWVFSTIDSAYTYLGEGGYGTWHPYENSLVYRYSDRIGATGIVRYCTSSTESDTLLTFPGDLSCRHVAYSPDGLSIAFFGIHRDEQFTGIYVFDLETEIYEQVHSHFGSGLSWGPLGIVYNNDCGEFNDPGCGVLWLLDTETWQARQITERFQFIFEESDTGRVQIR